VSRDNKARCAKASTIHQSGSAINRIGKQIMTNSDKQEIYDFYRAGMSAEEIRENISSSWEYRLSIDAVWDVIWEMEGEL
jgi:hypothetical protein